MACLILSLFLPPWSFLFFALRLAMPVMSCRIEGGPGEYTHRIHSGQYCNASNHRVSCYCVAGTRKVLSSVCLEIEVNNNACNAQ